MENYYKENQFDHKETQNNYKLMTNDFKTRNVT